MSAAARWSGVARAARRSVGLALGLALLLPAASAQDAKPAPADLATAIRAHPHLSKLALERAEAPEPYQFLFQPVPNAPPQRAAALIEKLVPALEGTRTVFERDIARPGGLAPRAASARFPVIVLSSRAELESYQRATRASWHLGWGSFHDRELNACVLYDELSGKVRPWLERVRAARHVFVHSLQALWSAGAQGPRFEGWILEGMADALSSTGPDPAVLRPDPDAVYQLVECAQDDALRFPHVRTLDELFRVGEAGRLEPFFREHWPRGLERPKRFDGWAFARQAALFSTFLWSDAARRPALVAFWGDALRGAGTPRKFAERFRPAGAEELERAFLNWTLAEYRRAYPLAKPDPERVLRALARGAEAGIPPPPPTLELDDLDPEERLALAIFDFSRGAEERAARALAEIAGLEELAEELRARVECERRRLAAWRELRDAHVGTLAAERRALSFTVAGKTYQARVLSFAGGELVLEPNRSGKERLALAELDALELAQEMKPQGSAHDWARLVPYALRGDARAQKLLKDDGGDAGALRTDAREDYPPRLRLGRVLARIEALARAGAPASRKEAELGLAEVRALRAEGADLAVVQRKEPALLEHARVLLEAEVAALAAEELFAGKLEALEGQRVRIVYDFDDPRELLDFEPGPYPAEATAHLPPTGIPEEPFHVTDGRLVANGKAGLRSRFELGPPLSVRYRLAYVEGPRPEPVMYFYLGVADDRAEHFVAACNLTELLTFDARMRDEKSAKPFPFVMTKLYALELVHDGAKVTLRCEDQEVSIAPGQRKNGALFLHAHTIHPVQLAELVIEGELLPASLPALRKARVARELATF